MAYIIYTNENNFVGIADNDIDRDNFTGIELYQAIEISDADYLKVKNGELNVLGYDAANSQHNLQDFVEAPIVESKEQLDEYFEVLKDNLNCFLEIPANESKSIWSKCKDYKNYLDSFDTSSLSYPINSTWEKYCSDNSISYVSSLQVC